jgi:CRISPR system Cascade subunit CasD
MSRHLLLVLEGPLLAFGGEAVDAHGVVDDFPSASMLTGLLANALGWRRGQRDDHARLQTRLRFAARIDAEGQRLTDFQTVKLEKNDTGWTTRGVPEGRDGGAATYNSPHIRRRDYDADKRVTVALRLDPADEAPKLDDLEAALHQPARPLFLGRKPCLPSRPLFEAIVEAPSLLDALAASAPAQSCRVLLPVTETALPQDELRQVADRRDWHSGVHGGQRTVRVRHVAAKTGLGSAPS